MGRDELARRFREAKSRASGRWSDILVALGVERRILNRRNQPCPIAGCGGTDRFQFTDKFGDGNYHCRSCGPGDGFSLLAGCLGCGAVEALEMVERHVGVLQSTDHEPEGQDKPGVMLRTIRRIWTEAKPIEPGDEVDRYLSGRGLGMPSYPPTLRCHPALGYYERDEKTGRPTLTDRFPAMVACVEDAKSRMVALHRTYLRDGRKIEGRPCKKLLNDGIVGAAVRLAPATEELAVCEGIENCLAVLKRAPQPVWSGLSAGNLERLWIPPSVRILRIYGDNDADANFDGQASSYILARRFMRGKGDADRDVQVYIPKSAGADWASVLEHQACRMVHAA